MNDRFKFRFWHKPTNKMLDCYGFNEHCTFANTLDGIGTEYNPCATKDCELMQCTGLKDKNGKLIYEGDILKLAEYSKPVEVKHRALGFVLRREPSNTVGYDNDKYIPEDCEVIGNIYGNPELLEVSNDH